jgi:hypothetical protein
MAFDQFKETIADTDEDMQLYVKHSEAYLQKYLKYL